LTGINDLPSVWRNGKSLDYSDQAALLLMSLQTAASKEHILTKLCRLKLGCPVIMPQCVV